MHDVVSQIEDAVPKVKGKITFDDTPLPLPDGAEDSELIKVFGPVPDRPLSTGIEETIAFFRRPSMVKSQAQP